MNRFSWYPVGNGFLVRDRRGPAFIDAVGNFARLEDAKRAVEALNALRPTWFASTFRGVVYVDVRAMVGGNLYADARSFMVIEGERRGHGHPLVGAVADLETRLHKYVALHG